MSGPQYAGRDTVDKDKPTGRDDPGRWQHGAKDALRDTQGGTYGQAPGQEDARNMPTTPRETEPLDGPGSQRKREK
jgi:hypothetical protein